MSDIELDFNRVKRSELQDLYADMETITTARDISGFVILDKWMARTITKWPFEGDPGDVAAYSQLGLEDYMEAVRQFSAGFRRVSNPDNRSADNGRASAKGSAIVANGGRPTRRHAAPSVE